MRRAPRLPRAWSYWAWPLRSERDPPPSEPLCRPAARPPGPWRLRFKRGGNGYRMACKPPRRRRSSHVRPPRRAVLGVHCPGTIQRHDPRGAGATTNCGSRRNCVTAVGVTLTQAPDAPSRGEVRIRIPSGSRASRERFPRWRRDRRRRAALGDIHPSGDTQDPHAPVPGPGRMTHPASARTTWRGRGRERRGA